MKEWNAQKRKECKRKCKAHVAAHLGSCIGANVLYSLPIILLMLIVYLTMFGSSFALLVAGADESAVAQAMLRGTGSGLFTAVLLLLVVSGPLTFGLMRFYTDLTRGGRPGAGRSPSADHLGRIALDRHPHVVLPVPAQSDVDRSADRSAHDRRCCGFRDELHDRKHRQHDRRTDRTLCSLRAGQLPDQHQADDLQRRLGRAA